MGACLSHNDAPKEACIVALASATQQPEGSSKGSSKRSSSKHAPLDVSLRHFIQQAAAVPDSTVCDNEELTALLELAVRSLGCLSAHLVLTDASATGDAAPIWLHAYAPACAARDPADQLQAVLQECCRNAGKIILQSALPATHAHLSFSAAPLKAVHSSQTHGCLVVMHHADSTGSTAGCRAEMCVARLLFNLADMALRVLERQAHLANRLLAEGLPVPPALIRMGLPDCVNEAPAKNEVVVDISSLGPWTAPSLPQNVLMMSGVQRQMQEKQDVLHSCSLIVDTSTAGWPVLHTTDTWVLWSGLKRVDTVGLPLQSLLKNAKQSAASLRWSELELSAARGHSFVLCDVSLSLSGIADSLLACSAYNTDPPREGEDVEGLLQVLVQHEKQSQAGGVSGSCLSDQLGIHSITSTQRKPRSPRLGTTSQDPFSLTDSQSGSGSGYHSSARPLTATWTDSELPEESPPGACLGPRFDLCLKPLATTSLDQLASAPGDVPKACTGPLAGLYEVQLYAQGVLPLPEEMLQATAKVDDADHLNLGDLAECFWPGLEVGRKLGTGGYGSVYQGVWHNVRVAMKVQDFLITTPRQLAEAQLEVLLGQQLGHPNLVQTLAHAVVELKHPEPIQFLSMTSQAWLQVDNIGTGSSTHLHAIAPVGQPQAGGAGPSCTARAAPPPTLRCLQLIEYCNAGTFQDGIDKGWLKLPDCCDSASSITTSESDVHHTTWRQQICMDSLKVLCVVHDICSCMHYLHAQGLAHADLSAGNVLLNVSGPREADMKLASLEMHVAHVEQVKCGQQLVHNMGHARPWLLAKVSDLGAARFTGSGRGSVPARCCGTPTHMAPEVLANHEVSQAADAYSLGVLLWQICHQQPACPGMSYQEVMRAIAAKKTPVWKACVGCTAQLAALGRKCCAVEPSSRPTALEALLCIRRMMAEVGDAWAALNDRPAPVPPAN